MTQHTEAGPGPEDDEPDPPPEDVESPEENEGRQLHHVELGPYDDPLPEKRSRLSSLLRSWWYVLLEFFHRS